MNASTEARVCCYDGQIVFVIDTGNTGFRNALGLVAYRDGPRGLERVVGCLTEDLQVHTQGSSRLGDILRVFCPESPSVQPGGFAYEPQQRDAGRNRYHSV